MTIPIVPLVVWILGALIWARTKNTNVIAQEMGKWCFIIGLFWTVGAFVRPALHLP